MTIQKHDDDVSEDTGPLSMRAYAKLRGCNVSSVSRAVAEGKLAGAIVTVDGKPMIRCARVADDLWQRNTRPLPNRPPELPPQRPPVVVVAVGDEGEDPADYFRSRALREAALARKEAAAATTAELELAKLQGDLVDANEVRATIVEAFTRCKTHLLGVPSKFRQACPHIAPADLRRLTVLVREALEQLAEANPDDGPDDGADGDEDDGSAAE